MSNIDDTFPDSINPSVRLLIDCWRNELAAPEILPFQMDLITELKEMIDSQQVRHIQCYIIHVL